MTQQAYSIAIAGSTGLVGKALTSSLAALNPGAQLHLVVRRPLADGTRQGQIVEHIVDFSQLASLPCQIDVAYCCLGTTIAEAGTQAAFRAVDFDAALNFARASLKAGAKRFGLVSSLGADSTSAVFYNRVKGDIETAIRQLGFEHVVIARPSLLRGQRAKPRRGERIADLMLSAAAPLMRGPLRKYRAIDAQIVGSVLAEATLNATQPCTILESDALEARAT